MQLTSLKEILLKKSQGNKNLETLIEFMGADVLASSVMESLSKMAQAGQNANLPIREFGGTGDETNLHQLRDAIGHHLGHYKAALKAHHAAPEGSPEATKFRQTADQHLDHALPLLHLAAKSANHSEGQTMLKYPSMMPWEANYTTMRKASTGKNRLHRDPKGLRAYEVKSKTGRGDIPNHHYFEMPPNPGHSKVKGHNFNGGYPWEEIQFGRPDAVDKKGAYLNIPDVEAGDKFTPHPFDKHPISKIHKVPHDNMSDAMKTQYDKDLDAYHNSPEHSAWLDDFVAKEDADPEHGTRPTAKGTHFYDGIPLKQQQAHVNDYPHVERGTPSEESWETENSKPAGVSPSGKTVGPTVRKKAAPAELSMEDKFNAWSKLPPNHQEGMLSLIPGLADYVAQKKGGK